MEPNIDSAFSTYLKLSSKEKLGQLFNKGRNNQKMIFPTVSSFKINKVAQDIIVNPLLPTQSRNSNRNKENFEIHQLRRTLRT